MLWIIAPIILIILLFIYAHIETKMITIKKEDVFIPHLPKKLSGLRVGFISDIHADSSSDLRFYKTQLKTMQQFQPDLLLLGGDYSNSAHYLQEVLQLAAALDIPMGIVAVRGNHDCCVSRSEFARITTELGIQTNFDGLCYVHKNNHSIAIACLDDYELGSACPADAFIQESLPECTICLTHQPKSLFLLARQRPRAAEWIDAAFCGHTHAGQVTFFGLWGLRTNRPIPIRQNQWISLNGIQTMESNGMGQRWNIRFFARPQIHCMTWYSKVQTIK